MSIETRATEALQGWSRFTEGAGGRLHWLDAPPRDGARGARATVPLPLVFVPGFGEEALDHVRLIELLAGRGADGSAEIAADARGRRVIIPDLRGRGASDTPERGFALEDHVADLGAILDAAEVPRLHMACYSRGTAYAVGWTLRHPERVASLVIGDYPAEHIVPPEGAVDLLAGRDRFGRPMTERVARSVMEQVFRDCANARFYDALGATGLPVLVVRGGRASSMVTLAVLERYRSGIERLEIEVFESSGHDLWQPDAERFARTLARFAARHDEPAAAHGD